jgi:hypothetical protein
MDKQYDSIAKAYGEKIKHAYFAGNTLSIRDIIALQNATLSALTAGKTDEERDAFRTEYEIRQAELVMGITIE